MYSDKEPSVCLICHQETKDMQTERNELQLVSIFFLLQAKDKFGEQGEYDNSTSSYVSKLLGIL
jgi:hypothetical protein